MDDDIEADDDFLKEGGRQDSELFTESGMPIAKTYADGRKKP